jgi:hypothetical protein
LTIPTDFDLSSTAVQVLLPLERWDQIASSMRMLPDDGILICLV